MRALQDSAHAEARRLLRALFVRHQQGPSDAASWVLLRLTNERKLRLKPQNLRSFSCAGVSLRAVTDADDKLAGATDRLARLLVMKFFRTLLDRGMSDADVHRRRR